MAAQHRASTDEALDVVTWNMDYCFMGDHLEEDALDDNSEEKQEGKAPVLDVYDDDKEAFWTLAVDHKGPIETCVKWSVDRLEDSGSIGKSITVKSGQEESLVALHRAIFAARAGHTIPIKSPVRCSKSNRKMERAVRSFHGQLRVLKFHFERGIGK